MTPQPLGPSPWAFEPDQWPDEDCVGVGADLAPETIVGAYRVGAFPMPAGGARWGRPSTIAWWSPTERGVLPLDGLVVSRSLRRSRKHFEVTLDESFEEVVRACADPGRPGAWINEEILEAYVRLHELGWAHSVETRDGDGGLVGGLYGLAIGGLFAGESMFHHARDASKVALAGLVDVLSDDHADRRLIDVQWQTPHLASLGVTRWPRARYLHALETLAAVPLPPSWR